MGMRGDLAPGPVRFLARRPNLFSRVRVRVQGSPDAADTPRDEELDPVRPRGDILADALADRLDPIGRGQRPAVAVGAGKVDARAEQAGSKDQPRVDRSPHL